MGRQNLEIKVHLIKKKATQYLTKRTQLHGVILFK